MLKAVLDTNVLISSFASPAGIPGQIYNAWLEEKFVLVLSEYILNEFERIAISKLKFENRQVSEQLQFIRNGVQIVNPLPIIHDLIYPNDWPILGTALAGGADFLVTGDKRILKLAGFSAIPIITPVVFFKYLQ